MISGGRINQRRKTGVRETFREDVVVCWAVGLALISWKLYLSIFFSIFFYHLILPIFSLLVKGKKADPSWIN